MSLAAGTKLGPYEILVAIGAGGMGEVYKARDTRLDRIVAIKVSQEKFTDRFEREARAVAALNHPRICTLHDVGPDYLVMEYVEGKPLEGPLPLDQALRHAVEICDALDHAHRRGVIHRDLKPSNILVTKSGIKLLDFGLAKMLPTAAADDATQTMALTGQGQILGTLYYMSPEQLQGQEADARSDLFSAGLVVYEMITGRKAFDGRNPASVIAAILQTEPAPLGYFQPMAPQSLDRIVRRCLRKDPEQRWQNARDLMLELNAMDEDPLAPAVPARAWLAWTVAAAAILAAIAVAVFIPRQYADGPARQIVRFTLDTPGLKAVRDAGLSPDGTRIAFTASDATGVRHLYLRALDSNRNTPVEDSPLGAMSAGNVAWSPDGRSLLFQAMSSLRRIDLSGGASQLVFEPFGPQPTRGFTWASSGTIILNRGVPKIQSIPDAGGKPIDWPDSGVYPYALPDGRLFLYQPYPGEVRVGDLTTGTYRAVAHGDGNAAYAAPGYLLFRQGDDLFAQRFDPRKLTTKGEPVRVAEKVYFITVNHYTFFTVSQTGVLAYQDGGSNTFFLAWHDRTGKQLSVAGPTASYWGIDLSQDGTRLAVARFDSRAASNDIWTGDAQNGATYRFSATPLDDSFPAWSHDGRRILYARNSMRGLTGSSELCIADSSGGQPEKVIYKTNDRILTPTWSPDGKVILFSDGEGNIHQIFPDRPTEPAQTWISGNLRMPQFSPDGKWVAYASYETGQAEIYVRLFENPAAGKWQISINQGSQPRWRADGQELYYIEQHERLMAVGVRALGDSFTSTKPQALFPVTMDGSDVARFEYAVTPDGKRFLVQSPKPDDDRLIHIVLNWDAVFRVAR